MILKYKISIAAVVSLMIVGLSMGLVFGLKNNDDDDDDVSKGENYSKRAK